MSKIISFFITFLNRINKLIWKFIIFLSKFIKVDDVVTNNKPTDEKYKQFKVDDSPLIEPVVKIEHKDYRKIIKENNIKPISRKNGKQTQFECKVCSFIFSNNPYKQKDVVFKCPHCQHTLSLRVQRADYDVFVCKNSKCRYYLNNLATLTLSSKKTLKKILHSLKCITFIVNFTLIYLL